MKNLIFGFIAGIILATTGSVLAGTIIPVKTNPLFDPIDPTTGAKLAKDLKAPKVYTQQQNDMSILYGRLDYMVNQLNQLQDKCLKK